jgi:hypothetical protein
MSVMPSIRCRRLTTSRTAAVTAGSATPGEARGLDDHVAALGLAIARRRLVEVVLADLAAQDGGEDDEGDPAEDGCPTVLRAPSTGSRREIAGLHQTVAP